MNKKTLIIVLVVVAVIAIGAGAYFVTQKDNDSSNNESTETSQNTADEKTSDTKKFNLAATTNESFTATLTGTTDGEAYTATIEYDGSGNSYYKGQSDGKDFELYLFGDKNIVCSEGQCIETANNAGLTPIDQSTYEISDDDLAKYQESALYKGTVECSVGTCDKWEVSISEFTGTILVDNDGRINQVTAQTEGSTYTLDYTYGDVTITPPENVITLPSAQ